MEHETIKERFLGTIFGQAVGDALGLSTEFMSKQEVDQFYPNGIEDYSQIVQDDHRRRWQRGDWTDDTDMMLCILDSFVACQKVDVLDIARRFKEWMMNGGMGIGRHTYNVMALGDYTSNPQKAAEIIWKMGKKKAAANGAVMRTSVVGLLKENVTSNAENICKLTHFDPRCVGSCVVVSSIIHALVFEDRILDEEDVIGIAKQYDERIVPFVDLAYYEGLDSLCLDDEKSMGYTLRTLGAALWAYWHATSYKEGILKIVLSGGDADTNAAVAGLSWVLNLEYAIFLTNGRMVFSMLLCSMTRCRISTQCIAKRKDSIMNVMQLNTDIYNSLGVLSNDESYLEEALASINQTFTELKLHREGKMDFIPAEDLLNEL